MDLARKEKKDRCGKDARFKRQMNVDKNIVRKMVLSFLEREVRRGRKAFFLIAWQSDLYWHFKI